MKKESFLLVKPHFYCDACSQQVDAQMDSCPHCHAEFSGIRCPVCLFNGDIATFSNGCPSCGYNKIKTEQSTKKHTIKKTKINSYPWNASAKELSTIAVAFVIATIAILIFYHLQTKL